MYSVADFSLCRKKNNGGIDVLLTHFGKHGKAVFFRHHNIKHNCIVCSAVEKIKNAFTVEAAVNAVTKLRELFYKYSVKGFFVFSHKYSHIILSFYRLFQGYYITAFIKKPLENIKHSK